MDNKVARTRRMLRREELERLRELARCEMQKVPREPVWLIRRFLSAEAERIAIRSRIELLDAVLQLAGPGTSENTSGRGGE